MSKTLLIVVAAVIATAIAVYVLLQTQGAPSLVSGLLGPTQSGWDVSQETDQMTDKTMILAFRIRRLDDIEIQEALSCSIDRNFGVLTIKYVLLDKDGKINTPDAPRFDRTEVSSGGYILIAFRLDEKDLEYKTVELKYSNGIELSIPEKDFLDAKRLRVQLPKVTGQSYVMDYDLTDSGLSDFRSRCLSDLGVLDTEDQNRESPDFSTTSAPSDNQATPAPSDNEATPAPSDNEATPAPSDNEATPAPPDNSGNPEPQ